MTFLDDYSRPRKRLGGKKMWPVLGASILGFYFLSPSNENEIVVTEPIELRNLRSLEELANNYDDGIISVYSGLEKDTAPEAVEKVLNDFESLPKEKKYHVLGNLLKNQSAETVYGARDYAEQNLDELIFFLFGGGT